MAKGANRRPPRPKAGLGERHVASADAVVGEMLAEAMPGASRRTLKQLVEHGRVSVDGRPVARLDAVVRRGSTLEISPRGGPSPFERPLPPGLDVVYSDDAILVVEKPAGMLTVATDREKERTVYARLRDYVKRDDPLEKIFIVHRLDRRTSGLLVFAKSEAAKRALQDDFADRRVDRIYTAVVEGKLEPAEGELRNFLVESKALRVHVVQSEKRGVEAILRYRAITRGARHTLVEVALVTGRKAQIRAQFAHAGHPLVGDREYGGADEIGRLALHATRLSFDHPVTRRRMTFTSRAPREFARLVVER
jgi:23S rRNA pseudouridine1911/1915/1917 synthase